MTEQFVGSTAGAARYVSVSPDVNLTGRLDHKLPV